MKFVPATLLAALVLSSFTAIHAEDAPDQAPSDKGHSLKVGSPAPALTPAKWLKGEAVSKFEPGKLYLVEFWASWCGPCRASIPHLTKLQKKYSDVTFIGVDCMEQDADAGAKFVKTMGEKMDYRVAQDDNDGKAAKDWLEAAGAEGIPTAFIVGKDSSIQWIGHPMQLDQVLPQVIAGTFDPKKAAAFETEMEAIGESLSTAAQSGDVESLDKLAKEHPGAAPIIAQVKFQVLTQKKEFAALLPLARQMVEDCKGDSQALNLVAWAMVDPENPFEKPDLDLALKAAQLADELTQNEDPAILDTLARVYFTRGDVKKAIELQTKAVSLAGDEVKESLTETLEEYKSKGQ